MLNFNVFGFWVLHWIFSNIYYSHIMTSNRYLFEINPMSQRCVIYSIWEQHASPTIYSASVVDKATKACLFECHKTRKC